MRNLYCLIIMLSVIFLYWCTVTAYDKVMRVPSIENLHLLPKQSGIITHLQIPKVLQSNDLSIYYSGIKQSINNTSQQPAELKQDESKVQEEILKIVKNKQNEIVKDNKEQPTDVQFKPTKLQKNIVQYKNNKQNSDDAFSVLKKKKVAQKKSTSVFDVIE